MSTIFNTKQVEQFKCSIALMRDKHPHPECTLSDPDKNNDHIMHWYLCQSRLIKNTFIETIRDIFKSNPKVFKENIWKVQLADSCRFTIYGPTIALRVCGGRIGALDGKVSKDQEVRLFTRFDKNGNIDLDSQTCYFHQNPRKTLYDMFFPTGILHAEANNTEFWNGHDELLKLEKTGIQKLVEQFCYVME